MKISDIINLSGKIIKLLDPILQKDIKHVYAVVPVGNYDPIIQLISMLDLDDIYIDLKIHFYTDEFAIELTVNEGILIKNYIKYTEYNEIQIYYFNELFNLMYNSIQTLTNSNLLNIPLKTKLGVLL